MEKTVVIYGSSTGMCEDVARRLAAKLGLEKDDVVDVAKLDADTVARSSNLLLGTSTWGAGELQDDWYDGLELLKRCDLSGKTVALFGCGDSVSYGDTFCGAMAELWHGISDKGVRLIGQVPTDGYTFDDSEAATDGHFIGLALDEVNEDDKTEARMDAWVEEIKDKL
jgi:flavodoxin I